MFSTNGVQYLLLYKRPSVQSPPVNSLKKTFPSLVWGKLKHLQNLPSWLSGKESACKAEDWGSVPGSGRSPGEGNGNPLQYSCLENPMDRGAWWATVQGVAVLDMTEHLSTAVC